MRSAEREQQILEGAIKFFSERGLEGQLRELARDIGITHALLFHYFPTKQALVDRMYEQLFEGRWDARWEGLLDDPGLDIERKMTRFYRWYAKEVLSPEWVRILIFSGLSDRTIPDRFFGLLRRRLFPRLIRQTRIYRGVSTRGRASARELELLMGLHGGIFYMKLRQWVYGQAVHSRNTPRSEALYIRDRVRAYLMSTREILARPARAVQGRPGARRVDPMRKSRG